MSTLTKDELNRMVAMFPDGFGKSMATELLAARKKLEELEAALVVTDEMVERAEAAVYPRHERGFLLKPLIDPVDMRAALEAALPWKPALRRRSLVKAAALILAEIERLDRRPAP